MGGRSAIFFTQTAMTSPLGWAKFLYLGRLISECKPEGAQTGVLVFFMFLFSRARGAGCPRRRIFRSLKCADGGFSP
jgi:hypothetical protein